MARIDTDVCVIGGGSGGLSVAAGAVQMGARVVLLEGGKMGGDCLNHGCVPSKSLLAAARRAQGMGGGLGVAGGAPEVDFGAVKDHVANVIAQIAPHDSVERFEGLGVRVIRAHGRFLAPHTVVAGGDEITARRFVIATGSRPAVPPVTGLDAVDYLTNETIFALRTPPAHLVILGGGPIGIEMAQAHRRLGSAVTVIEAAAALGREDPELAAVTLEKLRREGVEFIEQCPAARVDRDDAQITITLGDGRAVSGSHLLVATGRRPALDGLGLDAAGIAHDAGGVRVDRRLRSTNRRVHAIGDAAGQGQFTHLAGYHAGIVIRAMLFALPARARSDHIPRVTYTDPELAHVGMTRKAAEEAGIDHQLVTFPLAEVDRAIAEGATTGELRLLVRKGRIIGASLLAPHAGEIIHELALAIAEKVPLHRLAGLVHAYPTLAQISKRAAGSYYAPQLFSSRTRRLVKWIHRLLP